MLVLKEDIIKELVFKASRSGGKGGQNVNKVSTRVEVFFHIPDSYFLNSLQKELLMERLGAKLSNEGVLRVVADKERSQLLNKELAINKLVQVLNRSLHTNPVRKPSKPSRSSITERLEVKNLQAIKKQNRRKDYPGGDEDI